MKWNDIDLKTWCAYEDARTRYAKDPARYRRRLSLPLPWYGLLALLGICFFLFILGIFAVGTVGALKQKEYIVAVAVLFTFGLFPLLLTIVFFQRGRAAGMPLDPEKFGRLYDEVERICRDLKIAPIRQIRLDLSDRVTVVPRFRNRPRSRRDTLVVGYPLICALDARSFRICLMRALQREKAPDDPLLTWIGRVWLVPTGSNPFVTGEVGTWNYVTSNAHSTVKNMLKQYVSISPLQRVEEQDGDASCREAFGARDFTAAVTRARFLAERCAPRTLLLRCLAGGTGQPLAASIRDEVRKTLPEAETIRLLGRMLCASEPVMETCPAFRERVGTDDPAALLPYLQSAPDAVERYLLSCAEFEAEYDAWLDARIRKAKTDEVVRRLREKEEFDESSADPAAWTAALDAAARLGHVGLERDLLKKAVEKFPDHTLFRGKQLARRIRDAASAEEETEAAAELERITRDDPALVLEFHGVLYDSAVRRGDADHVRRLLAARESAKKCIAQMKRGKKNPIVGALQLAGMLLLLSFECFLLLQLLTSGRYGFRGYFIGGAHIAVIFCWISVQDRKERRERKAEKATPATAFDDTGVFSSPEPEDARPLEINLGGLRLSPNRLFDVLFVPLMLAGVYHIIQTERELGRNMEAAMTAYEAKDFETAARHIRTVAERNDAEAQCLLGVFYAEGRGVEQDYAEAVKWFRKAAKESKNRKGISGAQCRLGDCYFNGTGVEQDLNEAAYWYRRAARQGNHIAQRKLGDCYANGTGVEQNIDEALKWYRKAADQGDEEAEASLERIEDQRDETMRGPEP